MQNSAFLKYIFSFYDKNSLSICFDGDICTVKANGKTVYNQEKMYLRMLLFCIL